MKIKPLKDHVAQAGFCVEHGPIEDANQLNFRLLILGAYLHRTFIISLQGAPDLKYFLLL